MGKCSGISRHMRDLGPNPIFALSLTCPQGFFLTFLIYFRLWWEKCRKINFSINGNSGIVQDTEWALLGWGLSTGCVDPVVTLTHFGFLEQDLEIINIKMRFSMTDTSSHFGLQRRLPGTSKPTIHCSWFLEQTFPSQQMDEPPEFRFEGFFFI